MNEETTFYQEPKDDPLDRIVAIIGDDKQPDFKPQIKIERFENEVNFSARILHNEKTPVVIEDGETIRWEGQKMTAEFYQIEPNEDLPDGAAEVEITLLEKPKTNVIQFSINTKGLVFYHQPELTPEEIEGGAFRPENIVGSYAIYFTEEKRNLVGGNKYQSGKFGHIYRPRIEDSKGSWTWGDLNIDAEAGLMTVTIPQEFLDNAVYPLRHAAGATFGYTSVGGSSRNIGTDGRMVAVKATPSAGDVTKISFYGKHSASGNVKGVIWKASDSSVVSNSVSSAKSINSSTAQWWDTSTYSPQPAVTAQSYYTGVVYGHTSGLLTYYYDSGSTNDGGYGINSYSSPTTLSFDITNDERVSVYATYTPSVNNYTLDLGGSISMSGSIRREVTLQKSGSVSAIGTALKSIARSFFGSITGTGVAVRQGQLLRSGASTPSGSIIRAANKNVAGSSTPGGSLKKDISVAYAGSSTPSGSATRQIQRTASGSITPSGTLLKEAARTFLGQITPTSLLVKLITKAQGGSVTPSGSADLLKAFLLTVEGSLTPSGSVFRQVSKNTSGSSTVSGVIAKAVNRTFGGSITASGLVDMFRAVILTLTGSISASGTARRETSKNAAGQTTAAGSVVRNTTKYLTGSVTPSGDLGRVKTAYLLLTGSSAVSGLLRKEITRSLAGSAAPAGLLQKTVFRTVVGSVTPSSQITLLKLLTLVLTGTVTVSGDIDREISRSFAGSVTASGRATRLISRMSGGQIDISSTIIVFRAFFFDLGGEIGITGTAIKNAFTRQSGSVTPSGTVQRTIDKQTAGQITVSGAVQRLVSKFVAGVVAIAGAITRSVSGKTDIVCSDHSNVTLTLRDYSS